MTTLVAPESEVTGPIRTPPLPATASTDAAVHASLKIFQHLTRGYPAPDFALRFWDGSVWTPDEAASPRFTVVLQHPGALRRMFLHRSQVGLGEAFLARDFAVEGDLESSFRLADHLTADVSLADRLRTAQALLSLPATAPAEIGWHAADVHGARHSPSRDRKTVTYHYDTSNDFFAAWLDAAMVYSCAYFSHPAEDLEAAQQRKLGYICRKLRLHRGERLLDIGCGWGGLLIHAARHFDVEATGITLSEPQVLLARERIALAGLGGVCRVDLRDYREMSPGDGLFDKIASVGMVEHVGIARLPEYFAAAWRLLRPGGAFLLHGIGETPASKARRGPSFADHYVFPDSELPGLGALTDAAEAAGFEVRDVENLREHYVLTLRSWRARLERNRATAVRAAGETAYELWRLFMAGSAYRFRIGHYLLYQTLLVKPDHGVSGLPLTRGDWYAARRTIERCL